jgi:DNA-binding NarL/FixJ family response regulator
MMHPMTKPVTAIALIDDHSLLRGSLASLINSFEGYTVLFEADNGKEFIQNLQQYGQPDIVLLDVTMPEMDGFETAEWIKNNISSCKILVLSMMDKESAIIRMLKLGARGYLLKDSKPAILLKALDEIRNNGFFMNELVSNKMLHYVTGEGKSNDSSEIPHLTEKEIVFIKLACSEMPYKEIADKMKLSQRTVEGYRDDLFKKLNVASRVGLVLYAIKNGIVKI